MFTLFLELSWNVIGEKEEEWTLEEELSSFAVIPDFSCLLFGRCPGIVFFQHLLFEELLLPFLGNHIQI